jgi:hypothetical protein
VINQTNTTPINNDENLFLVEFPQDGYYNWSIVVTDSTNLTTITQVRSLTVDTHPPEIFTYYPGNESLWSNNNVSFMFSSSDIISAVSTCSMYLNDSVYQEDILLENYVNYSISTLMPDGYYNWSVTCKDEANNSASSSILFFTVEAPPNVTLISPPDLNRTKTLPIYISYVPFDYLGIEQCELLLDDLLNDTEGSPINNQVNTFIINNISEGLHNWTVRCYDSIDNNSYAPDVRFLRLDTTGPSIILNAPLDGQSFNMSSITFNYTANDSDLVMINCSIRVSDSLGARTNFTAYISGFDHVITITDLFEGAHYWNVTCTDDLGNSNTTPSSMFIVNPADLVLSSSEVFFNDTNPDENSSLKINATVYNIGGVTALNASIEFWDGSPDSGGTLIGIDNGSIYSNGSRTFSVLWNITLGYHTIYVLADPHNIISEIDDYNNNATKNISVLRSFITYPSNGSWFNYENITLNFTIQDYTGGTINYTIFVNGVSNGQNGSVIDGTLFSLNVTLPQGLNYFQVKATDELGRIKYSLPVYVVTDYTPPAPLINVFDGKWFNSATPQINISVTDNYDNMLNYTLYINDSAELTGNISSGSSDILTLPSQDDGIYLLVLEAFDDYGNIANSSFKTIYIDTHLPSINIGGPADDTNFTIRNVTINYTVSDNMASYAMCNLTLDSQVISEINSSIGDIVLYNLTSLSEGNHQWNLTCRDQADNHINSQTYMFSIFIPPVITLVSPYNNSWSKEETNTFIFNVSDETGISECYLIINSSLNSTLDGSQIINNGTNNFSADFSSGIYEWSIECQDNTSLLMQASSPNRTLNVDMLAPVPIILTENNSWFSDSTPAISINISDNMDSSINYTIYINGTSNNTGITDNSEIISVNLPQLSDGFYLIGLEARDEAGNMINATSIVIKVDTHLPAISLIYPPDYANISVSSFDMNFSVSDNLAPYLTCNLTLDGSVASSDINVSNGEQANVFVGPLNGGNHYWNVSCTDPAGNINVSQTYRFYILMPDLYIDEDSIYFNNSLPLENETITVYADIRNIGLINASNFIVEMRLGNLTGQLLYSGMMNLSSNQTLTIAINYSVPLGESLFYVLLDTPLSTNGSVFEENESNNYAFATILVGTWQFISGNTDDELVMNDVSNTSLFRWIVSNSTGSNLYASDSDSAISWSSLQAIGRTVSNASSPNNFVILDSVLNSSTFPDSINKTYTFSGDPIEMMNFTVFRKLVLNVSVVNSTNNSNFKTGILWDYADGGASYSGTQDIVFISEMKKDTQGYNGTSDFEMRIPARLRAYQPGQDTVSLYIELT